MMLALPKIFHIVIPAQAGITLAVAFVTAAAKAKAKSDSRLRGNDDVFLDLPYPHSSAFIRVKNAFASCGATA
jgi:hypothetical protein